MPVAFLLIIHVVVFLVLLCFFIFLDSMERLSWLTSASGNLWAHATQIIVSYQHISWYKKTKLEHVYRQHWWSQFSTSSSGDTRWDWVDSLSDNSWWHERPPLYSVYTTCSITKEAPYSWCYLCQIVTNFLNSFTGWFDRIENLQ